MTVFPLLVLDTKDLQPFIDVYRKQLKDTREFVITGITPVLTNSGLTLEIKAMPVVTKE